MQSSSYQEYSLVNSYITTVLVSLAMAVIFVAISAVIWASMLLKQGTEIVQSAGFTWSEISHSVEYGLQSAPITDEHGHKNLLLLGLDSLNTRPGSKPLTDTMLLASLDLHTNSVSLVSLPRDLWSSSIQNRINALYSEALEQNIDPNAYVTTEIEQLTGITIHHTVIVTLDTVSELVDVVGGVPITIEQSFSDPLFPRSDVDVSTVTDPTLLYETVTFESGPQVLTGERALQFARSRHAEGAEGTDLARAARQQKLVAAIAEKLLTVDTLSQPDILRHLALLYGTQFKHTLPVSEIVAVAKVLLVSDTGIEFSRGAISIYPEDSSGVLFHPPEYLYNGQWVYTVRDSAAFQTEVHKLLGYEQS